MTAHDFLEGVSAILLVVGTLSIVIGIHRSTTPRHDRDSERRQMREERRRPGREQ